MSMDLLLRLIVSIAIATLIFLVIVGAIKILFVDTYDVVEPRADELRPLLDTSFYKQLNNSSQYLRRDSFSR